MSSPFHIAAQPSVNKFCFLLQRAIKFILADAFLGEILFGMLYKKFNAMYSNFIMI